MSDQSHTCPDCGKPFPGGLALLIHRRYKHRAEWNADQEALKERIRAQTEEQEADAEARKQLPL